MRIKENWLALVFSVSLAFAALIMTISFGPGWCKVDEPSLACTREWVNATGSLLTVVAAAAAAAFAYRQFQAAHTQNRLSRLDAVEDELSAATELREVYVTALNKCEGCKFFLNEIVSELDNDPRANVRIWCTILSKNFQELLECSNKAFDVHLKYPYNDFVEIYANGLQASDFEFRVRTEDVLRPLLDIGSTNTPTNVRPPQLASSIPEFRDSLDRLDALIAEIKITQSKIDEERLRLKRERRETLKLHV